MRWVLAVLSHGERSATVEQSVDSFLANTTPPPLGVVYGHDGRGDVYVHAFDGMEFMHVAYLSDYDGAGFCAATEKLWRLVAHEATEYQAEFVLWLEHDFTLDRSLDIGDAATLLDDHSCAQVQLMRQPVNETEKRHGGVVASRPNQFEVHEEPFPWLRQRAYFTTNPSVMRTSFMRMKPFRGHRSECEGKFGIALITAGFYFAVLGTGEPWVTHIGELRTGHGY